MIAIVVRQGAETDVVDAQQWYTREVVTAQIVSVHRITPRAEYSGAFGRPPLVPTLSVTHDCQSCIQREPTSHPRG